MQSFLQKMADYGADVTSAMNRCVDDEELYQSCVELFVEDQSFDELEKALAQNNLKAAFEAAHTLKGVSANLSLMPFGTAICALVEPLRQQTQMDYTPLLVAVQNERKKLRSVIA